MSDRPVLVKSYTEAEFQGIPRVFLDNTSYGRALQRMIPACVDIVFIDPQAKRFYLAKRRVEPLTDWWWFGGGIFAGETKEEAVARVLKRETHVDIQNLNRLELVAVMDYRWRRRAQAPCELGCHMLGYTFLLEPLAEELKQARSHLDHQEYDTSLGICAFGIADLNSIGVHQAVVDLYHHVFDKR